MSKIKIKSCLISDGEKHIFEGKGILKNNQIIYNDGGVLTTITLGETVYLERKKDYYYKLGFCMSKYEKGTYIISEGNIELKTFTNYLKCEENRIEIRYSLIIDNVNKKDFILNLQYHIDT